VRIPAVDRRLTRAAGSGTLGSAAVAESGSRE